jgi:hypothetical protein
LNKELKKLHYEIRQNEKTTKFIKNSLFNNFKNLNDNYIFNKNDDGVYQLKEYEIKKSTSTKLLTKAEKINNKKLKIKEEKERMVKEINNCKNNMTSLLNNLLD